MIPSLHQLINKCRPAGLAVVALLAIVPCAIGQNFTMRLWDQVPNRVAGHDAEQADSTDIVRISKVSDPTIEVFLPARSHATGQAVLICPGGGYQILAYDWEGTDIAKWLNGQGIAGIVLKYRLPDPAISEKPHLAPLQDAKQAMRLAKRYAPKWGIDPDKVGVMGFSAGGHLAATLGTQFDQDGRPAFMVLVYPVVSMKDGVTHRWSRKRLIGDNPTQALIDRYSAEANVAANTPPTFLLHATDDKGVPVENSLLMYGALKTNNVPVEMHILPEGGHGFALGIGKKTVARWPGYLADWLAER